eukprot:932308-Pyramimonas_sp.AAC.1
MPTNEGSCFGAAVRSRPPSDSVRSARPRTEPPRPGECPRGGGTPPPSPGLGSPSSHRPRSPIPWL